MFCSKCGAEAFGPYCANCGALIISPKSVPDKQNQSDARQSAARVHTKSSILGKSANCTALINETEQKIGKTYSSISTTVTIFAAIGYFSPYIIAVLNNEKIKNVEGLPFPLTLLLLGLVAFTWYYTINLGKTAKTTLDKYRSYCSKETLIISNSGIYGSSTQGKFDFTYNQIHSVTINPHTRSSNLQPDDPFCDIFIIKGTAGKQHVFYSFTNCNELKTVINAQLKEFRSEVASSTPSQQTASESENTTDPLVSIPRNAVADYKWVCPSCNRTNAANRATCWCCNTQKD